MWIKTLLLKFDNKMITWTYSETMRTNNLTDFLSAPFMDDAVSPKESMISCCETPDAELVKESAATVNFWGASQSRTFYCKNCGTLTVTSQN